MKEKEAIKKIKAFLQSAEKELNAGNTDSMIINLFSAQELAINTYKMLKNGGYAQTHQGKLTAATRAFKDGFITSGEFNAYKRVLDLKTTAQYHPYIKKEDRRNIAKSEPKKLYHQIKSLVGKIEKLVNGNA